MGVARRARRCRVRQNLFVWRMESERTLCRALVRCDQHANVGFVDSIRRLPHREMDIATRHWRHVRLDYEPGLAQHSMCIYHDTLYIFGGFVDQAGAACGRLHMYRLKSAVLR